MEFDRVLTAVQGRLNSIQKDLNIKLCDISTDHEDEINRVVDILKSTFTDLELENPSLKKVHLLIVLNSDFVNVKHFEEDRNFWHVFGVLPKLSKYLYFKLVTKFNWHTYFSEFVLNFAEILTFEVLESIADDLKYIDWDCALAFIYSLYDTLFLKVLLLQSKCKFRIQKCVKLFLMLSKFKFDEILRELDCPLDKKQQYLGYIVRMFLDLVDSCIRKLNDPIMVKDSLYDYTIEYDYSAWKATNTSSNWGHYCLGLITSKCAEAVMSVSIDIYMSWTEVEVNDAVGKTLQMSVREAAYVCRESVKSLAHLYESVTGLKSLETTLASIALRPITEDEEIEAADVNTIVMNLLNPKRTQIKWLRGLIQKGIFESPPCMKVVTDNSTLMDYDTTLLLLNKAVEFITSTSVTSEEVLNIKKLVFNCLKALSSTSQVMVLQRFCQTHGNSQPFLGSDFDREMTKLFNKLINQDDNKKQEFYSEMVCLAIESRDLLVRKALEECLMGKDKATLILDLLHHVSPICSVTLQESGLSLMLTHILILFDNTKDASEKVRDNFVHLIRTICSLKMLDPTMFTFSYVTPSMENALKEKNWTYMHFYLDLVAVLMPMLKPKSIVLTSLIARILHKIRPKVQNFKTETAEATSKCIAILSTCVDNIIKNKTEEDSEVLELRKVGETLSPLTWQYMIPIWSSWGKDLPGDPGEVLKWRERGFGHGGELVNLSDEIRPQLVTKIVKILPQLTKEEWERIGGTGSIPVKWILPIFQVLADCILILFQLPFVVQNQAMLGYIITNFMNYSKLNLIPRLKNLNQENIEANMTKLNQIMDHLPEELSKTKMANLLHLKQLFEAHLSPPVNEIQKT